MIEQPTILVTAEGRQRLVRMALGLVENTPLVPQAHERRLLDLFVNGDLTIDQVLARLEAPEAD